MFLDPSSSKETRPLHFGLYTESPVNDVVGGIEKDNRT